MNACDRFRDLIDNGAFVDSTAEGYAEMAEHAAKCAACAARLAELRRAEAFVGNFFRWADPGEAFNARVLRGVCTRPARTLPAWLVPLAAAAVLVLGLFIVNFSGPERGRALRPKRIVGSVVRASGGDKVARLPIGADLAVSDVQAAIEIVRGVGFALRPESKFRIGPESMPGYTKLNLQRGGAAVSVKTDDKEEKVEIAVGGFRVLASDADFLVEEQANGGEPGLYVDRGQVVVSFSGGVSVVESGEHVSLTSDRLLNRVRADAERINADLAALEAQCADLKEKIARYEEMIRTYGERRRMRHSELLFAQEALAAASDEDRARQLEEQVSKEMLAVENLDYVMGEHLAKVSALRAQLPASLDELRRARAMVARQTRYLKEGIGLLAQLRNTEK